MKTTLLSLLLALSSGLALQSSAEDAPREAPQERKKDAVDREHHRDMEIKRERRQKIEEQLKANMEEAAKLEAAGKKEEAEQLRRSAKQRAMAAMHGRDGDRAAKPREEDNKGPRPETGGPPPAELQNKLGHVEQAVAHLKEAGMPDAAAQINQMAERLRNELRHGKDRPRHEEGHRAEGKRDEPRHGEDRKPDHDIDALRREVQELRQAVRQLNQRKSEP